MFIDVAFSYSTINFYPDHFYKKNLYSSKKTKLMNIDKLEEIAM